MATHARFLAVNIIVWCVMTMILIVLPDGIERWIPLEAGRAMSWAVAGGIWMVVLDRAWQRRAGTLSRFFVQVMMWGSSALTAIWVSDQFRV